MNDPTLAAVSIVTIEAAEPDEASKITLVVVPGRFPLPGAPFDVVAQ